MTTSPLRRTQITVVERIRERCATLELLAEAMEKPPEIGVRQAGTTSRCRYEYIAAAMAALAALAHSSRFGSWRIL
jgi:hypothetical protein